MSIYYHLRKLILRYSGRGGIVLFGILFGTMLLNGCSKNDNNPVGIDNPGPLSRVQGRVTNNEGFQKVSGVDATVQGATVTLAEIQSDGTLKTISKESVQSDASGNFTVETSVEGAADLVVVAQKGSNKWEAVVSSSVKNGITVYAPPLNNETTVETEIFLDLRAQGRSNIGFADISDLINTAIAVRSKGDAAAISGLATSIKNEFDAKLTTFTSSEIGGTQAKWQQIVSARARAQAVLDRDLYSASDQTNINAAFNNYTNATINAYVNAGLDASAYAKIFEAASRILINSSSSSDAGVLLGLEKQVALLKAKIINYVVQAEFTVLDAGRSEMNTVINAAVTLSSSITAAQDESDIIAAFDVYHTTVVNALKITLGINSTEISTIESDITGYKTNLKTSASPPASSAMVIDAYMQYYTDVKDSVESNLDSLTQAEISATTQILILLNAQF